MGRSWYLPPPLGQEKQVKEGKPETLAEALDHTGPTAADVASSILHAKGFCVGQEKEH